MRRSRSDSFLVTALAHGGGLVLMLVLALSTHTELPSATSRYWAAAAGASGGLALLIFYRALSKGMGLTAPVAAVLGAAIPAAFTMITHGLPGKLGLAGFLLAGLGIWLISRPDGSRQLPRNFHGSSGRHRLRRFFLCINRTGDSSAIMVGGVFAYSFVSAGGRNRFVPWRKGSPVSLRRGPRDIRRMPGRERHGAVHSR